MKNRIRWVLAALLLMGFVWASAATLGYDVSFGSSPAAFSGSPFAASGSPATPARVVKSGLIDGLENRVFRSNQDLSYAGRSYTPIKVAIDTNPLVGANTSFNDLAGPMLPTIVSFGAQPETFALLPTERVALGSNPLDGQSLSISDPTVATEPSIPSPVPEPETYAMLLAGLLVLVFVSRRRAAH